MASLRPLRGRCQCGRNQYIIQAPEDSAELAQVLFNTDSTHQIPLATPLAAYIRVPLSWYQSTTLAFFPDESHTAIRRVYSHPTQQHSKRHFCGFCGTPLSYWSENPQSEAEYIQLTLCSLLGEDLRDLEELGLIPEVEDEAEEKPNEPGTKSQPLAGWRESNGVPWFNSMVEGTRLGSMRQSRGVGQSKDGKIQVSWEIIEVTDGDVVGSLDMDVDDDDVDVDAINRGKRKMQDRDEADAAV